MHEMDKQICILYDQIDIVSSLTSHCFLTSLASKEHCYLLSIDLLSNDTSTDGHKPASETMRGLT